MATTTACIKEQVLAADGLGCGVESLAELVLRAERMVLLAELDALCDLVHGAAAQRRSPRLFDGRFPCVDALVSFVRAELDRITRMWSGDHSCPWADRRAFRSARAYLLKDSLVRILDCGSEWLARIKLDQWIRWARRSRLEPFKRIAGTIRDCTEGILAYVRSGLSNGRTEGLNGKARTITRRSYGFHSSSGLIALLMLCCSGIHLDPVQLQPGSTH